MPDRLSAGSEKVISRQKADLKRVAEFYNSEGITQKIAGWTTQTLKKRMQQSLSSANDYWCSNTYLKGFVFVVLSTNFHILKNINV